MKKLYSLKMVAPRSTPEQQSNAANSEFAELNDTPIEKSRSILKENEEFRVEPPTPHA